MMLSFRFTIFVVLSIVIVFYSWASFRNPRSHGFFRFFAWEAITVLFALNVEHWFTDFFSLRQIVSSVLLTASLVLVIEGVRLLKIVGQPEEHPTNASQYHFEQTTRLVTVGVYRYIRHPMYSSLLLLAWGIFLKDPSIAGALLAAVATALLIATAKADEREDLAKFGADYAAYMKKTKMFIPFIF